MSSLKPDGELLKIEGVERRVLFTLNAIEEIQEEFDASLEEVINALTDKREAAKTLKTVLSILLNDEAERKKEKELKTYTPKEVGWLINEDNMQNAVIAVLKAYGMSLPEPDEFENPKAKGGRRKK